MTFLTGRPAKLALPKALRYLAPGGDLSYMSMVLQTNNKYMPQSPTSELTAELKGATA